MPAPDPEAPPAPILALRDVTRTFEEAGRSRTVLAGASTVVRRGEIAVLLGRSGSGKSTLLHLIAGIDRPTSGDVLLEGISVPNLSERERTLLRRRRIGFVFQFFNLIPTLTVEENLRLPLELAGKTTASDFDRARDLLAEVGLGDRAGAYPDRLSGGEQQRIAVARALVHEPAVVLADEPTGNLDLETGLQVLALLDRLTRRAGKTLIMVTHSQEVIGLADRRFELHEGRLVERGTAEAA